MLSRALHYLRANGVAFIALFVALGGTGAYAANELVGSKDIAKNAVKSKHIGRGQVKAGDVAANAVSSLKVANGSLLGEDFAAGQLPRGEQGPAGSPDTPEMVRDKLTQVDGTGSGVDADRLDGISGDGYPQVILRASELFDPRNLTAGDCDFKEVEVPAGVDTLPQDTLIVTPENNGAGVPFVTQVTALKANTLLYAVICNNGVGAVDVPEFRVNFMLLR